MWFRCRQIALRSFSEAPASLFPSLVRQGIVPILLDQCNPNRPSLTGSGIGGSNSSGSNGFGSDGSSRRSKEDMQASLRRQPPALVAHAVAALSNIATDTDAQRAMLYPATSATMGEATDAAMEASRDGETEERRRKKNKNKDKKTGSSARKLEGAEGSAMAAVAAVFPAPFALSAACEASYAWVGYDKKTCESLYEVVTSALIALLFPTVSYDFSINCGMAWHGMA